ncbi:AKA12 protein, partial [Upupa epops]|nr:AKA12 protein [Upupa epops]
TVGEIEHSSVTLKEDTETMETNPCDSGTKDGADAKKEGAHMIKQLPSMEEDAEDSASEPQSYDLGFKKIFRFVGFRFTVKKEKTGKSEPVQLLTVKKETQAPEQTDDQTRVISEEITMPEDVPSAEDTTKDTLKNEGTEDSSPKTLEANETCSQSAALATDTASPSRKFFTQGWTLFRKKKSFRKPKEDEQSPTKEEEQEKAVATLTTENSGEEEKFEVEKQDEQMNVTTVTIEAHENEQTECEKQDSEKTVAATGVKEDEKEELVKPDDQEQKKDIAAAVAKESVKEKKAEDDDQESEPMEVSEAGGKKELKNEGGDEESEVADKPLEVKSVVDVTDSMNKTLRTSSEVLPVGEEVESAKKCEVNERTDVSSEEKLDTGSLAIEISPEQLEKSDGEGNEPAVLGKETGDEKAEEAELKMSGPAEDITEGEALDKSPEIQASKEQETKLTPGAPGGLKSLSTSASSADVEDDQESVKSTNEAVQGKSDIVATDTVKPDETTREVTPEEAAGKRPPEGITNEAELLSSQERTKLQGSPLKKLFTGTGLKKLSGKKHKGKRGDSKLQGEQGESIQQLSDSPDSPEEQNGESSASSPEEMNEIPSLEKPVDGMLATENEDSAISDMERKSVTPWASFKKMVTPKKRVRRPSGSDKEEDTDKTKSVAVSATENTVDENQGELKENGMDLKPGKTTEEPKRKVDTSVSWEAFICVGSSKKRARKSWSSDEETEPKLSQESQKAEESGQSKDMAADAILPSSQESDQGQGNSSPEQAGSPSEGEGISTWESFKRLVTPRRRSKTRMEERTEDSVVGSSLEHSTSDGEPGKDELWVPFRKLMPRRRKKKSDGKAEPTHSKEEDVAETTEEDSDIPAVVPLSEYEAAEQEKIEAQQAKTMREETSEEERAIKTEESLRVEQAHEGLVHAVTVMVVEGERVVTSIEERSPSWISATLTEYIEQDNEEKEKELEKTAELNVIVEEPVVAAKAVPEMRKGMSEDTTANDLELTSEAVTALEETAEASSAEETMGVSLAEETTEMVSAVSQLLETPDTTEEATPVKEVEATEQNLRELDKQTQKVLHDVAERVRSADVGQLVSERTVTVTRITAVQGVESEEKDDAEDGNVVDQETVLPEQPLEKGECKEDSLQPQQSEGSIQSQNSIEESVLQEGSGRSEMSTAMQESMEECKKVEVLSDESQWQASEETAAEDREEATAEDHEEIPDVQETIEEPSSCGGEFQSIKTVPPKEKPFAKQEPFEQEKLPTMERTVEETRDEHIPEVETAVQNKTEDETSSLGPTAEEPAKLEEEGKMLPVGSQCTAAMVAAVPVLPKRPKESSDSEEQACTEEVPSRAPAQRNEDDASIMLLGVKGTEVTATEVLLHNEMQISALPSETVDSHAATAAEQSMRDEAGRHSPAEDSVPIPEIQCREKPTETPSQSHETKGGEMEDATLKMKACSESDSTVTEAPALREADSVLNLVSACPGITESGSAVLTGIGPMKCESSRSSVEEEAVKKEQELVETSDCPGFQKEDSKTQQSMERAKEGFESGQQELGGGDEFSTAVQQEVLTVQEEGSDSAILQAESLEALKVPVPVSTVEKHGTAETVVPAHVPDKTVQPSAITAEKRASEEAPVNSVDCSGSGTAELSSAEASKPHGTPAPINGLSEEPERPQSTEQPKQNGIHQSNCLSLTPLEFEKDGIQAWTIESQSTKLVLNALQTAVYMLAETEESAAFESVQCINCTGKSPSNRSPPDLVESAHQLTVKEEEICQEERWTKEQEHQQKALMTTAVFTEPEGIHPSVGETKDLLLPSEMLTDGPSQNSFTTVTSPEDAAKESGRHQKSTPQLSTSEHSTKDPLDTHPSNFREKEAGQLREIPDQHTGQHACRTGEEEQYHLPQEDGKTQTWEDESCQGGSPCDSPPGQNSMSPEALSV